MILIHTLDLFNALDKGNLGNAQTAGLSEGKAAHVIVLQCHLSGKGED